MTRQGLSRRAFLAAATATAASAMTRRARAATRPNILFLLTDDQRFDTIAALNNPHIRTPNLDRLVNQGTAFTHCYIQGSVVPAVCVCARSMLLTGRSLFRSPLEPTAASGLAIWPETFRHAGYETFATGKWHNGREAFARSFTNGGAIFFGGMHHPDAGGHDTPRVHYFDHSGRYPRDGEYTSNIHSTELFSGAAIDFLRRYDGDAPFLAWVSYTAPHDPRMAPEDYHVMYPPERVQLPPNFMPEHPFDNGELRIRDELLAPFPRTPEVIREHIAEYYAMISHLDTHVGRVLDALDESGHRENTIIIFASDNGLAVGQHGLMGKQNMYDHSLRVPLIVSGPGIEANRQIHDLVYLHDLFPTCCGLAGVPIPDTVESLDLAPLLRNEPYPRRRSVFAAYQQLQRMVRTGRHKLIQYPEAAETQLFDLQEDPWETKNLAHEPGNHSLVEALDREMDRWKEQTGDIARFG